jgi:RNase P subunit RPR2
MTEKKEEAPRLKKCRNCRTRLVQSPRSAYVASCPKCGARYRVDSEKPKK